MTLSDMFALSQRVSLVAIEESLRLGHPEVDVEHVLLGLLLTDGRAGAVLRSSGVTLTAARAAVEAEHAERVASLGLTPPPVEPRPLRDPAGATLDWSPRALTVIRGIKDYSDDRQLLAALLDEPGGFVRRVLARLDVDESVLRSAVVDEGVEDAPADPVLGERGWYSASHSGFVPAPPEQVWALVSDPLRRPEWDNLVARVEALDAGRWRVVGTRERPGGGATRIREEFLDSTLRQLELDPPHLVEWEGTWTARGGRVAVQRLRVLIQPTTGGTRVLLRMAGRRRPGLRGVVQRRLGPVQRFFVRQQLIGLAGGISRALR